MPGEPLVHRPHKRHRLRHDATDDVDEYLDELDIKHMAPGMRLYDVTQRQLNGTMKDWNWT